jgi:tetratricopeptide (TPR) repeat protein
MAIERRDLPGAEQHLRRGLSFYPAAVRSLSLLGRVLLEMRRLGEAREVLSLALQWHSRYMPAYRYLLSVAEREQNWEAAAAVAEQWGRHFNDDPCAQMRKGQALIRVGQEQEGMKQISEGMARVKQRWKFWQMPFGAELVQVLRDLDGSVSNKTEWRNLIVQAAERFPYGVWLASRAGAFCFQEGDWERGEKILAAARERLLHWQWQGSESGPAPEEYRGLIEIYRLACEGLARPPSNR